ncbi:MAG: CocE/NonD family hydrolase, partial [Actinomycetes bacterium]
SVLVPLSISPAGASGAWTTCVNLSSQGKVCGSISELYILGGTPSATVTVKSGSDTVGDGSIDANGALVIRDLEAGSYTLSSSDFSDASVTVLDHRGKFGSGAVQSDGFSLQQHNLYANQKLKPGINYITMRDGVKIAATVRLPFGETTTTGKQFPTLVEYSGYATAGPKSLADALVCGVVASLCNGRPIPNGSDPLLPSQATAVGAIVAPTIGFATVSVQIRGSGCSGGAFDLFGYPTDYDGYDAIETISHQAWVSNPHSIGMVGISYSGISQLEVAGTQPPDLGAIAPLSPTDDLYSTGYPGGIYNNGFAAGWIAERINDAKAVTATNGVVVDGVGQPWTYAEIKAERDASSGRSSACLSNQTLHDQAQSLATLVGPSLNRDPALFDRRSPRVWAANIHIPVYLVGSLQDEQTGPQWTNLISAFPSNNKNVFVTMDNGTHFDSLGPLSLSRWIEFLQIYVAQKVPTGPGFIGGLVAPLFAQQAINANAYNNSSFGSAACGNNQANPCTTPLPATRFTTASSVASAAVQFQAKTPHIRVLLDNGGGSVSGAMDPTGEVDSASWPLSATLAKTEVWGLYGSGLMASPAACSSENAPINCGGGSSLSFSPDPNARPALSLSNQTALSSTKCTNGAFDVQPCYAWSEMSVGTSLSFISPPLAADTMVIGDAALKLIVASSSTEADLQATVSEVRWEPLSTKDTHLTQTEEYVTSGFLRSSMRHLGPGSTETLPQPSFLTADILPLIPDEATPVSIPMGVIAHLFRKGTQIRITISAPGGDRPSWTFATDANTDSRTNTLSGLGTSDVHLTFTTLKSIKKNLTAAVDKQGVKKSALDYPLPSCSATHSLRRLYGSLRGEPCRIYLPEGAK